MDTGTTGTAVGAHEHDLRIFAAESNDPLPLFRYRGSPPQALGGQMGTHGAAGATGRNGPG